MYWTRGTITLAWCAALIVVLLIMLHWTRPAHSQECPTGAKSCKVLIVTPEEEESLLGDDMLLLNAQWANRVKFTGMVEYWRRKLATAPAGKLPEPPKPADVKPVPKKP